jgi:hypothetical protein
MNYVACFLVGLVVGVLVDRGPRAEWLVQKVMEVFGK